MAKEKQSKNTQITHMEKMEPITDNGQFSLWKKGKGYEKSVLPK